jgi:multisubunit Na+/H+ antiporter MnhE subunit
MWKKRAIVLGFLIYFICFWLVFSGIFNVTFFIFCLISVFFSFYLDKKFFFDRDECIIFPSFSFIKYLVVIAKDIFISANYVIKLMIKSGGNMPEPEIGIIPLRIKNPHVRSFIENSITATPGTFVIDSDNQEMLTSAIDKETMEDLVNRKFILKIYTIFKKFNFDY